MIGSHEKDSRVDVVILNRSYPPVNTVTGDSAYRLVRYLRLQHVNVAVVSVDCKYGGGSLRSKAKRSTYLLSSLYNGKNSIFRLISSVVEGLRLVLKAKSLRPEIVVVMTDPPLLSFWASIFLRQPMKCILWAMDLYPQAFCASKLIRANNPVIMQITRVLRSNPPDFVIALGTRQLEYLKEEYQREFESVILPCGIVFEGTRKVPEWHSENTIIFGYCGNLGRAHSIDFLLLFLDRLNPKLHKFVVAVYGEQSNSFLAIAKLHPAVIIVDRVPKNQLSFIDFHLTSLLPQWTHICVPSKTISAVSAGSNFVFCGSPESDNWSMLSEYGWLINYEFLETDLDYFFRILPCIDINEMREKSQVKSKELKTLEETSMLRILEFVKTSMNGKID